MNRAELDDALKQAVAPLIAQFDTCKQRLDRAADDGESPPPVEVQAEGKLTMNVWVVRFDAIGSLAGPEPDRQLNEVVQAIAKQGIDADCSINISGHTDTLGSDLFNHKLSERRAMKAADRIQAALPGVQVRYQGWGERRLQMMTDNGVANTDNRRVEIEVTCRQ